MERFSNGLKLIYTYIRIGAILCLFSALSVPGVIIGAEAKEGKKRPRFELTETTLRDWKMKLEWSRQKNALPDSLSWHNAINYARAMNTMRYGGYRDWRLPTREELVSLTDHAKEKGYDGSSGREVFTGLQQEGLTNIQDEHYWTQTVSLFNDRFAWAVDLRTGIPETIDKQLYEKVIVVRVFK